jgi:hypothetical protein
MFNANFNDMSVISWWSVLLVEKNTDLQQGTDQLSQTIRVFGPYAYTRTV